MANECKENAEQTCKSYPHCYGCNAYRNPTNYDRIRNMSVEEMAEFLDKAVECCCTTICNDFDRCRRNNAIEPICKNHYKKWLESEVADNE